MDWYINMICDIRGDNHFDIIILFLTEEKNILKRLRFDFCTGLYQTFVYKKSVEYYVGQNN